MDGDLLLSLWADSCDVNERHGRLPCGAAGSATGRRRFNSVPGCIRVTVNVGSMGVLAVPLLGQQNSIFLNFTFPPIIDRAFSHCFPYPPRILSSHLLK